jgi:Domain of unknown function (DUF4234)
MIYCTKCGGQNDDAARHCANCGAPFNEKGSSQPFTNANANAPQQPAGNSWDAQPYGSPLPMQAGGGFGPGLQIVGVKRDPVMILVYTLITCGIYGIWWWYTMMTEVKNALNRQDINPVMELVLSLVTCHIYMIYLCYKYPKLMLEMQQRAGMPPNDISTICVILPLFGVTIVSLILMQTELNKIWDAATRR